MKSVITKLEANLTERVMERGFVRTPYTLEVRGAKVPNALVHEVLDMETGAIRITVQSPLVDGKPVLALSTMDAIARRVKPGVKAYVSQGRMVLVRRYE
jgi:hypothetical protein